MAPRRREQGQVLYEAHARQWLRGEALSSECGGCGRRDHSELQPPPPPGPSSLSQSNSVNSYFSTTMSFKRLSIPVALFALVVLSEPPLALASRNTTQWRNIVQDPSSSDFTVSLRSGLAPTYLYEADGRLGVQCIGTTERYEQSGRHPAAGHRSPNLDLPGTGRCPPCFNCRLPRFKCGQYGECDPYDGQCKCPPGWGGIDCLVPRTLSFVTVACSFLTRDQSATRSPTAINEG